MTDASAEAVALYRDELELCAVGPGQDVSILAPEGPMHARAEAFAFAARELGARCHIATLPATPYGPGTTGRTPLANQPRVLELLKGMDLVVDLLKLLFSPEQIELQDAGCRVLLCIEPYPVLKRLFPTPEMRREVEAAGRRMAAASELRVTSQWGTDLTYRLGAYGQLLEYGYVDEPGRWDHWPAGFLLTHAHDDGVEGTLVLKQGDWLLLPVPHLIGEPVELTVERGYVTLIEGSNLDALVVRDFFERAGDDEDAWAVSHIGWGLNHAGRWMLPHAPGSLHMDARVFRGNVLFSTGPNRELGGTRDTPFHLDIPMRDCTLLLDGEVVVDAGRVVESVPTQP
jgi:2,5-dihydroxypyridine 5,6-dioxygenase